MAKSFFDGIISHKTQFKSWEIIACKTDSALTQPSIFLGHILFCVDVFTFSRMSCNLSNMASFSYRWVWAKMGLHGHNLWHQQQNTLYGKHFHLSFKCLWAHAICYSYYDYMFWWFFFPFTFSTSNFSLGKTHFHTLQTNSFCFFVFVQWWQIICRKMVAFTNTQIELIQVMFLMNLNRHGPFCVIKTFVKPLSSWDALANVFFLKVFSKYRSSHFCVFY